MENIYITGTVCTAMGKYGGSLKSVPAHTMGALVIQEAIRRAGVNKEQIDEVILGEVRQSIEVSSIARRTTLEAGLSEDVPGFTVNRLCASAIQALFSGCQKIWYGEADVIVAGGTENMSHTSHYLRHERWRDGPLMLMDSNIEAGTIAQPVSIYSTALSMSRTAEDVAEHFHITRKEQGRFTAKGQRRAAAAIIAGYSKEEILPVEVKEKEKNFVLDTDEFPRLSTTMEVLVALRSIVKPDGTVTAGNSCGLDNGASAPVLMPERKVKESGPRPLVRIVGITRAALGSAIMGYGPVYATCKITECTGMTVEQMDPVELNEAFASQAVVCIRDLGLDPEEVNINGGAVALGHPLGSTGTRLIVILLRSLMRTSGRYGLAVLCIGGGQSMAMMIEKLRFQSHNFYIKMRRVK